MVRSEKLLLGGCRGKTQSMWNLRKIYLQPRDEVIMSPTGKCRAQPEVTQLCTQLPGCEEPSEHETSCTATYWNAKKFAWNPNGSQSASVSLGIPLSCRKSWGLRWRSYHQVIQKISRDFSFLSRTQGSTHTHVEPAKKSATSLTFRSQ